MSDVRTWRYHLHNENGEGWAIAFLDSIGCFSVLSDYGNYGYRWPEAGWYSRGSKAIDFRAFFVRCGSHYLLRKVAPREVYDGARTMRAIKDWILESRRTLDWSKEKARREWDTLVEDNSNVEDSEVGFADWLHETRIDGSYELVRYGSSPQAVAFIERVIPRLRDVIRADLAKEGA